MNQFFQKIQYASNRISNWIDEVLVSNHVIWVFILTGVILRALHYFSDPSLWRDESALASNIVEKPFSGLLGPLDKGQMAPAGFLIIVKLLIQILGTSEYTLRLFPFICGLASIFFFKAVAMRILEKKAAALALLLFAISIYLVHYSAEIKQYSSDVAITLALYAFVFSLFKQKLAWHHLMVFFMLGTVSISISHPAAFILTGIGLSLTVSFALKREWPKIIQISAVYAVWFLYFLYFIFNILPSMSSVMASLQNEWRFAFMPFPLSSMADIKWFGKTFLYLVEYPLGLTFPVLIGIVLTAGCVSLYKRERLWLFLLTTPILIALIVSAFRLYPFSQRMMLYAVPAVIIIIAEGIQYIRSRTNRLSPALGLILIALVFLKPAANSAYTLLTGPPYRVHHAEEIKPVLRFIQKHANPEDTIYLYYGAWPAFKYYASQYGLEGMPTVSSGYYFQDWERYIPVINDLRNSGRIWFLFSHFYYSKRKGQSEEDYIINYVDKLGNRLTQFKTRDASVYLYDLNKRSP